MSDILATSPTTPKETKKMEKLINQEAKSEEKSLKSTKKDLDRLRKEEQKAHKGTLSLESKLERLTKREQIMLKGVHKAEHEHEIAVADLNQAKKEYQVAQSSSFYDNLADLLISPRPSRRRFYQALQQNYEKMRETLQAKTSRVEEAVKENNEHSKNRNSKLSELKRRFSSGVSGPSSAAAADRFGGDGGVIQTGPAEGAMPVPQN